MRISLLWGVGFLLVIFGSPAEAKHHRKVSSVVTLAPECNVTMPCEGAFYTPRAKKFIGIPFGTPLWSYETKRAKVIRVIRTPVLPTQHRVTVVTSVTPVTPVTLAIAVPTQHEVIGGRPAGCPHAFCGCGASLHLFGKIVPELNLAANWLRFPHVPHDAAQPRMAAARQGHVMVLESHLRGDIWLVYDANSGGGLTRLHAVSIARYTVVNPRI